MSASIPPPNPPSAAVLASVRAAMLQEVKRSQTSWKTRALQVIGASLGLSLVIGLGAVVSGNAAIATVALRWVTLLGLGLVGPMLVWTAVAPGRSPLRWVAVGAAVVVATVMVLTRPAAALNASSAPEWLCTALHLVVAGPAIFAAVMALRSMAPSIPRAIAAGLAAGTTGALLGEMLCERDAAHVAIFHLAAWTIAATLVVVIGSRVKRSSWAS
ncbi:MAG: NrsF family protein [Archangium sp.]